MTDHPHRDGDDDELVRQALASLREDVEAQPMPEPGEIRARAEGNRGGVIGFPSRRRRTFGAVAGVAAAALVATGAGFLTWNSSDVAPPATSTSHSSTESTNSSSSTPTEDGRLRMLDARDWAGVLGQRVSSTSSPATLAGECFDPEADGRWQRRVAELPDGTVPGSQWLGTAEGTGAAPTSAVDAAIRQCRPEYTIQGLAAGDLADGSHRILHATSTTAPDRWLVEVSRGDQVTLLSVTEGDGRSYSSSQMRRVALGVLGEIDLSTRTDPSTTSTATASTSTATAPSSPPASSGTPTSSPDPPRASSTSRPPEPSSTDSATPTNTTEPTEPTPSDEGSGTATSSDTSTSSPSTSTTSDPTTDPGAGHPKVGGVASRHFVDPSDWASPALTGDASSYRGQVEMEGRSLFTRCTGADGDDRVGAVGIRSGSGDANYFGQQWVLITDDADARHDELVAGFSSGDCIAGGTVSSLGNDIYKVDYGNFVTYLAVVRIDSGVSILHLSEARTAPEPLTDSVATSELRRLSGLAARH